MTTKLSDIQLVLLTTACQREDGSLLPPPESLGDQPARIRKAIETLIKNDLATEKDGIAAAQLWRNDGDLTIGVVVTDAGRAIIDPPASIDADAEASSATTPATDAVAASPRPATKQALLVDLLKRDEGATLTDIVDATGWLPHTSRAALTGLRKKGHEIAKEKVDGATRYQIKAVA